MKRSIPAAIAVAAALLLAANIPLFAQNDYGNPSMGDNGVQATPGQSEDDGQQAAPGDDNGVQAAPEGTDENGQQVDPDQSSDDQATDPDDDSNDNGNDNNDNADQAGGDNSDAAGGQQGAASAQ